MISSLTSVGKMASKAGALLSLLPQQPLEFHDRVSTFCRVRWEELYGRSTPYPEQEWRAVVDGIEESLGENLHVLLNEPACAEITEEIRGGIQKKLVHAPFPLVHNADFTLAQLCYAVCRATRPAIVLETGGRMASPRRSSCRL